MFETPEWSHAIYSVFIRLKINKSPLDIHNSTRIIAILHSLNFETLPSLTSVQLT